MPLIRKVVAAGWKPIPYATPSDPAIYVERFDDQTCNTFYLTAQNSSTSTKTYQMTVDGASLQLGSTITVKDLVSGFTFSVSHSGSNALFTDSPGRGGNGPLPDHRHGIGTAASGRHASQRQPGVGIGLSDELGSGYERDCGDVGVGRFHRFAGYP